MKIVNRRRVMGKRLPYNAEIEYLESTGTQYINTGILPSKDLRTKVVQAFTGNFILKNSSVFGSRGQGNSRYWANYDDGFEIGYGGYLKTSVVVHPNEICTIDFNYIKNDSHYFSLNGIEYNVTGTPNTQYSIVLFGRVVENTAPSLSPLRIYKVQFIRNNVLIGDLIPVRVGQVGYMYDKVSGQLFGNAGTGDFILGPDVTSGGNS